MLHIITYVQYNASMKLTTIKEELLCMNRKQTQLIIEIEKCKAAIAENENYDFLKNIHTARLKNCMNAFNEITKEKLIHMSQAMEHDAIYDTIIE